MGEQLYVNCSLFPKQLTRVFSLDVQMYNLRQVIFRKNVVNYYSQNISFREQKIGVFISVPVNYFFCTLMWWSLAMNVFVITPTSLMLVSSRKCFLLVKLWACSCPECNRAESIFGCFRQKWILVKKIKFPVIFRL